MSVSTVRKQSKGFIIMGPEMKRGRCVLQAIDALYYLPKSFRLVFTGNPKDQSFYNEVADIVERFGLSDRVRFMYESDEPNVKIADEADAVDDITVYGDSPEALASAILQVSRA